MAATIGPGPAARPYFWLPAMTTTASRRTSAVTVAADAPGEDRRMKGVVVSRYDAPLEIAELEPEPLTPGHARIQVLACGVCYSDVKIARGRMPFSGTLPLPHVPGHEIAGRVVESDPAGAIHGP